MFQAIHERAVQYKRRHKALANRAPSEGLKDDPSHQPTLAQLVVVEKSPNPSQQQNDEDHQTIPESVVLKFKSRHHSDSGGNNGDSGYDGQSQQDVRLTLIKTTDSLDGQSSEGSPSTFLKKTTDSPGSSPCPVKMATDLQEDQSLEGSPTTILKRTTDSPGSSPSPVVKRKTDSIGGQSSEGLPSPVVKKNGSLVKTGSDAKEDEEGTTVARKKRYRFNLGKKHKSSSKKREKASAKRERKATKTLAIVLGKY